ncbi:uncharacterized protein LOC128391964 isoform X2 [Panonychus citri]|uniref:uncharacterized protein LOC128391964 isoform X2 n=1 Tax=Panonychus citri TaxID=50023 RepID=UPI0023070813|nr:uncharacterized protein LOC128391964 isoform X2 [Panonychus citri]
MFKAGDFKVCLSSIEFSVFYQQSTPKCCPSCGYFFPPENLSEVRLSSLILVLGVGSWLCYKMIIKRKSKMKPKKAMSSCSTLSIHDQIIINRMDKLLNHRSTSSSKKVTAAAAAAAAAAATAVYNNLNHRTNHSKEAINYDSHGLATLEEVSYTVSYSDSETDDIDVEEEDDDFYSNENDVISKAMDQYSTMKRSNSISSQSGEIGEGTIAKIDQLLHQIEDIKESVGEMNSDFFNVHSYDHNRLLKSSDLADGEEDEHLSNYPENSGEDSQMPSLEYSADKEEPQTPSLEWDSNDISLFSELNGVYQSTVVTTTSPHTSTANLIRASTAIKQMTTSSHQTISSSSTVFTNNRQTSNINNNLFKSSTGPDTRSHMIIESNNSLTSSSSYRNSTNMNTSFTNFTEGTMSSSGVTSIDGSLLSSPDQERTRLESLDDMISKARRLGLLNDLFKALSKIANRDSAYFED